MKLLLLTLLLVQDPLINPNTATKADLMATDKAVTSEIADKIIKGRPYSSHRDVLKVVGEEVWQKIFNFQTPATAAPLPTVAPPAPPKARVRPIEKGIQEVPKCPTCG